MVVRHKYRGAGEITQTTKRQRKHDLVKQKEKNESLRRSVHTRGLAEGLPLMVAEAAQAPYTAGD